MKLSTLRSKLKLFSVGTNAKTLKSDKTFQNTLTAILYLAPSTMAGNNYNVCRHASQGCKDLCLGKVAGRSVFSNVQAARIRKTKLFFEDNQTFKEQLFSDLTMFYKYCTENDIQPYVRFNGTSDIDIQKLKYKQKDNKTVFDLFPDIKFYDYTKDPKRTSKYSNYRLTYSYSENVTEKQVVDKIKKGINVAVVFEELPSTWLGVKVINADTTDLRFEDEVGVICGLTPKGNKLKKAIKNNTDNGFVIRKNNIKNMNKINVINL